MLKVEVIICVRSINKAGCLSFFFQIECWFKNRLANNMKLFFVLIVIKRKGTQHKDAPRSSSLPGTYYGLRRKWLIRRAASWSYQGILSSWRGRLARTTICIIPLFRMMHFLCRCWKSYAEILSVIVIIVLHLGPQGISWFGDLDVILVPFIPILQ